MAKRSGRKAPKGAKGRPLASAKGTRSPARKTGSKRSSREKPQAKRGAAEGTPFSVHGELLESRARFALLLETAATPILFLSPKLKVLELNSEAERLYGRPRDEIIGSSYFDALDAERRSGLTFSDLKGVLAGRPLRGLEGMVRRPDGSERFLVWNAAPLPEWRGKRVGIVAVAHDITDRQRAEEALREREARLVSVISTAPDAIITIDERGLIQSFSAAAERLLGYAAGEVIGRNVSMLMPSPHREDHDAYLERYFRTGEKRIIGIGRQVEAQRKDGTIFPMELAVGEACVGDTRIFTGFIRDISSRAKMEQELRQFQKMEAIGQLTGGVAHDFNNLLTVIIGNLEMLESRVGAGESRDILGEAQEAAELGAKLANRLLAFGRRQSLNPEPIDLNALLGGMTDLLRRSLGEMVQVEVRRAPSLPLTLADPGQVENALLNLAINARDAMPQGGSLVIETSQLDWWNGPTESPGIQPGRYVLLTVTDTGVGMPAEVRERAFEPFFTTKGPGVGSGLGLSMIYGFAKQSGGHVALDSAVGRGTTVRLYLPAIEAGDVAPAKTPPAETLVPERKPTVLIVEDDPRVRRVSVRRLVEIGYDVIEADSAPAAMEALEGANNVDVLFTDVVMPGGMTGIELARAARRRRPGLKILFTSGYTDPADTKDAMLTDNADWLGKPYRIGELATRLRDLLAS